MSDISTLADVMVTRIFWSEMVNNVIGKVPLLCDRTQKSCCGIILIRDLGDEPPHLVRLKAFNNKGTSTCFVDIPVHCIPELIEDLQQIYLAKDYEGG